MKSVEPCQGIGDARSRDDVRRAQQLARIIDKWPAIDRERWIIGCKSDDPFEDPGHGTRLRLASRLKAAKGYRRWLAFLAENGLLDEAAPPEARLSNWRSAAYFHALQQRGNRPYTIVGRFAELNAAIKIMALHADRSCVLRPGGASIQRRLHLEKRALFVPDARDIYRLGLELMDTADTCGSLQKRFVQFRDGLLITILAARARRLGTTALTSVETDVRRVGERYRIEYPPYKIKTNVRDDVLLPERLNPYLDRYLAEIRPGLLQGNADPAFWVNVHGAALGESGIEKLVRTRTRTHFGVAIGPHRVRHALGTTAAMINPAARGLAATVLRISDAVLAGHYNRANADLATSLFHDHLAQEIETAKTRTRR